MLIVQDADGGQFRCRRKATLRFPGETTMTERSHARWDVPAQGIQCRRLAFPHPTRPDETLVFEVRHPLARMAEGR